MCGIAGFYDAKNIIKANHFELLNGMEHAIKHRGPDGYGYWLNDDNSVGIIHRRLSIQDPSPHSRQPFISANKQIVISFNGEIYNHPELKELLIKRGYHYTTNCDTETIVFAYQEWGIECLLQLNGMFAFALFDAATGDLFLARDRFGIKPLYFSELGGVVSFASEIKALRTLPFVQTSVCQELIGHYLSLMITPAPLTIFNGIYKLPAGWFAHVDKSMNLSFHQWYSPLTALTATHTTMSEARATDLLDEKLATSVKNMLIGDRPIGAFLSGGLDSSLIVALMAPHAHNISTFSIGYDQTYNDNELVYAQQVAKLFKTNHHEVLLNEQQAHEKLDAIVAQLDEPHADPVCIPFSAISQKARQANIPVVLVGEGADELFLGYELYKKYHRYNRLGLSSSQTFLPQSLKNMLASVGASFFKQSDFYQDLVENWRDNRALFWSGALSFTQTSLRQNLTRNTPLLKNPDLMHDPIVEKIYPGMLVSGDTHDIISYHRKKLLQAVPNASLEQEITYLELTHRLPELLLMRADKMSMMHGIETRVPFLDHMVAEFALQLPTHLKIGWSSTKYLLKKVAERYLPRSIVYRQKQGFSVPLLQWLTQGEYFPSRADALQKASQSLVPARTTYNLLPGSTNASRFAIQRWSLLQLSLFEKNL